VNRLKKFLIQFPILCAGAIFLIFAVPINYFFLGDKPNNPLEKAEEAVIQAITGIDVDFHPEE
jgi:hypothetical protein